MLKKLKAGKTPGLDGIPAEIWMTVEEHLIERWYTMFNNIWEGGEPPAYMEAGPNSGDPKRGQRSE